MSDHPVTLAVPDPLFDRVRQIAEAAKQPIEAILLQRLEEAFSEPLPLLASDEQAELDALEHLSDDALWTIAREQMSVERQGRMQTLMDGNSKGLLTPQEFPELEQLVTQGQRLMLRKAQAVSLLTTRGYTVSAKDMSVYV